MRRSKKPKPFIYSVGQTVYLKDGEQGIVVDMYHIDDTDGFIVGNMYTVRIKVTSKFGLLRNVVEEAINSSMISTSERSLISKFRLTCDNQVSNPTYTTI